MNARIRILFSFFTALATVAAVWHVSRPAPAPAPVTHEELAAHAEKYGYRLVGLDDLREMRASGDSAPLLVDTRQDWEFRTGHIKGSAHYAMEPTWLARLLERRGLKRLLGANKDRPVVFY